MDTARIYFFNSSNYCAGIYCFTVNPLLLQVLKFCICNFVSHIKRGVAADIHMKPKPSKRHIPLQESNAKNLPTKQAKDMCLSLGST